MEAKCEQLKARWWNNVLRFPIYTHVFIFGYLVFKLFFLAVDIFNICSHVLWFLKNVCGNMWTVNLRWSSALRSEKNSKYKKIFNHFEIPIRSLWIVTYSSDRRLVSHHRCKCAFLWQSHDFFCSLRRLSVSHRLRYVWFIIQKWQFKCVRVKQGEHCVVATNQINKI